MQQPRSQEGPVNSGPPMYEPQLPLAILARPLRIAKKLSGAKPASVEEGEARAGRLTLAGGSVRCEWHARGGSLPLVSGGT